MPVRLTIVRQPLAVNTFALTAQAVYDPLPVSGAKSNDPVVASVVPPGAYDLSLVFDQGSVLSAQSIGTSDHVAGVSVIDGVPHAHYYWSDIALPLLSANSARVLFERSFVVQVAASVEIRFLATPAGGLGPPDTALAVGEADILLPA